MAACIRLRRRATNRAASCAASNSARYRRSAGQFDLLLCTITRRGKRARRETASGCAAYLACQSGIDHLRRSNGRVCSLSERDMRDGRGSRGPARTPRPPRRHRACASAPWVLSVDAVLDAVLEMRVVVAGASRLLMGGAEEEVGRASLHADRAVQHPALGVPVCVRNDAHELVAELSVRGDGHGAVARERDRPAPVGPHCPGRAAAPSVHVAPSAFPPRSFQKLPLRGTCQVRRDRGESLSPSG